jgi:hypothetical protein
MASRKKGPSKTFLGIEVGIDVDERILKWAGVLVGEFVTAGIISFLIIVPQVAKIQQANQSLAKEKKNLSDLQYKSELLANFSIDFANKEDTLTSIFPQKRDVGLVVSSLRQLANDTQVELVTYSVKTAADDKSKPGGNNVPALTVELTVNGSTEGTQGFVNETNRSLPLKSIENLQVVRNLVATGSAVQQLIQTKLTVRSYYLPFNVKVDSNKPLDPFGDRQIAALNDLATYVKPKVLSAPSLESPLKNPNLF